MGIPESKPTTHAEKVRFAFDRGVPDADKAIARHFYFWLGGVACDREPESLLLLDLFLADEVTADEAVSEKPVTWIRLIQDLEEREPMTPSRALATWRGLNETERRLIVEKVEREKFERKKKGLRTEPTRADRDRLQRGAEALALHEPRNNAEILEQIDILHTGAVALQSMDDLGSDAANRRALRDMQTLGEKLERLQKIVARL